MTTLAQRAVPSAKVLPWHIQCVWALGWSIHLLYWISLQTRWLCPLSTDTSHLFGPGCDFFALYQAGHAARHGQSLYTYARETNVVPYGYPFRYLPIAAYAVGTLFTLVPPISAYSLWLGLNELCLLYNVRLTWQRAGGGLRGAYLGCVWLVFFPLFVHMWLGQFTLLLASMLFWSTLALEEGRCKAAQGWWIASVLWKPASLLWLPIWVRARRYWPGLFLLLILLAGNGLYFAAFPRDYAVFADANLRNLPLWVASNIGLSALIYQFTGPGSMYGWVRILVTAVLVAPLLLLTWRSQRDVPGGELQRSGGMASQHWRLAALWTTLFFLVYKEVWEQHMVLLLPFLVLGLWRAPSRWLVTLTVLLALPSPFAFYDPHSGMGVDPQPYFSWGASFLQHVWRVLLFLGLYGRWLWETWRCKAATTAI